MLIDCDACGVRGSGCADCVITALVGAPPPGVELTEMPNGVELDDVEENALRALVSAGLDPEFVSITANEPTHDLRHHTDWLGGHHADRQAG
ncbi:hypothetical protein [Cryptosporangium sp. NPDC048952]|uniref:hypothetical protein n=1 Tax=Cryptosporangium sp. NPDC048952 TaxID=3363961 RepID=UPI0037221593